MDPSFVSPPTSLRGRGPVALVADGLRRRGGRRALSLLSAVLLLAGVGLFAFPFATDLYQRHLQDGLRNQFASAATEQAYVTHTFKIGQGLTRLAVPAIGLDVLVVEGTTPAALRAGAGHYLGTPLPGQAGNVSIGQLQELKKGVAQGGKKEERKRQTNFCACRKCRSASSRF